MLPADRREILIQQLERSARSAWTTANARHELRNQYMAKIQFGLVALNGATLISLVNSAAAFPGLNHREMMLSCAIFALGVFLAGRAAVAQLTQLTTADGAASARAVTYDRCVTISQMEANDGEPDRLGPALEKAEENAKDVFDYSSDAAINLQAWSGACWIGGLIFSGAADLVQHLPSWWPF